MNSNSQLIVLAGLQLATLPALAAGPADQGVSNQETAKVEQINQLSLNSIEASWL